MEIKANTFEMRGTTPAEILAEARAKANPKAADPERRKKAAQLKARIENIKNI